MRHLILPFLASLACLATSAPAEDAPPAATAPAPAVAPPAPQIAPPAPAPAAAAPVEPEAGQAPPPATPSSLYVSLAASFLQPTNANPAYAIRGDSEEFLEYGYGFAQRVDIGRRTSDHGGLELSFWHAAPQETSDVDGLTRETVVYPGTGSGTEQPGRVEVEGEIDALTVDLTLAIPLVAQPTSSVSWLVGMRYVTYDSDMEVRYIGHGSRGLIESEADGYGLRTGVRVATTLLDGHLTLAMTAAISLLHATHEARFGDTSGTPILLNSKDERTATIMEARLEATIPLAKGFSALLGYELSQWNGLAGYHRFTDSANPGSASHEYRDVGWNGFLVGLHLAHDF